MIGNRIEKQVEVAYVYQELDDIPEIYSEKFSGRTKPWGTGQAILCCKDAVFYTQLDVYKRQAGGEKTTCWALLACRGSGMLVKTSCSSMIYIRRGQQSEERRKC